MCRLDGLHRRAAAAPLNLVFTHSTYLNNFSSLLCVYYFLIHVQIQLHFMSAAAAAHGKVPFFDLPLSPSRAVRRIYFVYMTIWQPTCGRIKKKKQI